MTFAAALDAFDRSITAVEEALDRGEDPVVPEFSRVDLEGPISMDDVDRYEHLMARMVACETRLQLERVEVLEELSGLGRRRTAANAYAAHV